MKKLLLISWKPSAQGSLGAGGFARTIERVVRAGVCALVCLLVGASAAYARSPRVSIGIGINIGPQPAYGYGYGGPYGYVAGPPAPPPGAYYVPARPRSGYVWVPGYYVPAGRNWKWRKGYWAKPPRGRSRWVAPNYRGGRYIGGYWR